ncbi:hypothetical protein [Paenibacillus terrigena]|uniref:hypothetical protein n=1 Tax=Paenibacillus terrigena TaxID=369333 RepID=UPI0012EC8848|nr:hypothetical protein [Paenibacillus terrigena]
MASIHSLIKFPLRVNLPISYQTGREDSVKNRGCGLTPKNPACINRKLGRFVQLYRTRMGLHTQKGPSGRVDPDGPSYLS